MLRFTIILVKYRDITDEAKTLLQKLFMNYDSNCLRVTTQKSCCADSLVFSIAKLKNDGEPILVNEIPVLAETNANERIKDVTIAVEDGKLVIKDASGCRC